MRMKVTITEKIEGISSLKMRIVEKIKIKLEYHIKGGII